MARQDPEADDDRFEPWAADPALDAQIQAATAKTTEELRDAFNAYGTARSQKDAPDADALLAALDRPAAKEAASE